MRLPTRARRTGLRVDAAPHLRMPRTEATIPISITCYCRDAPRCPARASRATPAILRVDPTKVGALKLDEPPEPDLIPSCRAGKRILGNLVSTDLLRKPYGYMIN